MTWRTKVDVSGVDVGESHCDMWHGSSKWLGATWPNHGLPRGTPGLANEGYVKKFLGLGDLNPGPPPHIAPSYQISDQRAIGWFLYTKRWQCYLI
jgi:hypothetical protein